MNCIERPATLLSIQYLRGVAALMVVAYHALHQFSAGRQLGPAEMLQGGVDIFFVISGFIMWRTTERERLRPALFLRRRLIRIVPLYWTVTSLTVALMLLMPRLAQSLRLDPLHLIASYLFLPWPNPTPGMGLEPLIVPGWTLNYEMSFYLLFAAALFAPRKVQPWIVLGTLALLAASSPLAAGAGTFARFYAHPILLEFAFGMLIAMGFGHVRHMPRAAAIALTLAGGALMLLAGGLLDPERSGRLFLLGIPAALIVGGAVLAERAGGLARIAFLGRIGDASYAIYLVHPLLLSALAQLWRWIGLDGAAFLPFALGSSLLAGMIVHIGFERPVTRLLQGRSARRVPLRPAGALR
ncbi:acyltransferase family protein [Sphingomonas oleivorans]|uniref:acyltransferase family protein n=1 Tax=Sphingomonas oleivorans TaxID=1735121 RepID=UPI0013FD2E70|nr:acyltransferase [Sphingomonas oleivorans]